ncbi:MAG: TetR family transcriptional regulator [Inquilinaceae bacterium]
MSLAKNMAPPPPRGRDSERTKRDILMAAMDEFSEFGDGSARIDRIARRAGANKALIYTYFGNKEDLYAAVLREAYAQIRHGERALDLDHMAPEEAMRALVRFTLAHFRANPWFLRLLNTENQRNGQTIRTLTDVSALHSPLVALIRSILRRGEETGVFRTGIDPVQLYVSIASLFYFPLSNVHTLSAIFQTDIGGGEWIAERGAHAEEMILGFLMHRTGTP